MDFDSSLKEDIEHPQHGQVVMLHGRDDEGVRLAFVLGLDGDLVHPVEVEQELLLVEGGGPDQALGERQFIIDEVPQPPPAARPGIGVFHAPLDVVPSDLGGLDIDRRGEIGGGPFAEKADDVVQPARVVAGADPPAGKASGVDDAPEAVLLEVISHVRSAEVDAPPEEGLDIGDRGVHIGRDEHPGGPGAHLMLVDVNLGEPVLVEDPAHGLRFGKVEHEPVPVVVVSRIALIEPGHGRAFVFRTEVFAVPVAFHLLSVRVRRRNEKHDDVLEDFVRGEGGLAGDQVVGQLHRHLGRGDFGRMQVAGDEEDDLAFARQRLRFFLSKGSGVPEFPDDFPVGVEPGQVFFG